MGPHEPYWRTNTSFSPPPATWDYHFRTEGLRFGSNDSLQLLESSASSNSKESRSWVRGSYQHAHQYPTPDGAMLYCSSPSDTSLIQPWTPPPIQGIGTDELGTSTKRGATSGPLSLTPTMEGTSIMRDGGGSTSSRSEGSDFDHTTRLRLSAHRSFQSRRSFMSKPIHPLSYSLQIPRRVSFETAGIEYSDYENTPIRREMHRLSSGSSSVDLTDISEQFESESLVHDPSEGIKCGLCDRFLSQRSPWSSRRIVRNGDMPVAGVLSCSHVFHAECLDQATPKAQKNDPPCPFCSKVDENQTEQPLLSRLRNSFVGLKASPDAPGPSRSWSCSQSGDCVEGAIRAPHRSSMMLLNRNRTKKSPSLKGNTSKELPGKLRKIGSHPLQLFGGRFFDQGSGSCSKAAVGPSMKREG